jgi:hypothetical protein
MAWSVFSWRDKQSQVVLHSDVLTIFSPVPVELQATPTGPKHPGFMAQQLHP